VLSEGSCVFVELSPVNIDTDLKGPVLTREHHQNRSVSPYGNSVEVQGEDLILISKNSCNCISFNKYETLRYQQAYRQNM